jgi:HTH-type transcriptional regulator/antitoxin HigA
MEDKANFQEDWATAFPDARASSAFVDVFHNGLRVYRDSAASPTRSTMKSMPKRSERKRPTMKPRIIKTQAQYEATLARIEEIFDARPGTAMGDELELLLLLVETYEDAAYPIDLPDPILALRFRMEQGGLRPKDLIPYIGSKSKVSEVLSGQRPLSLTMIRKLVAGSLLPAEVALQARKTPPARRTAPGTGNRHVQAAGAR